jgi:hypothetical protein
MGKLPKASAPPRALPPLRESAAADQSAVSTLQTYLVQAVGLPGSEKGDKGDIVEVSKEYDMYPPPHMTCILLLGDGLMRRACKEYDMYPPPHRTCILLLI